MKLVLVLFLANAKALSHQKTKRTSLQVVEGHANYYKCIFLFFCFFCNAFLHLGQGTTDEK